MKYYCYFICAAILIPSSDNKHTEATISVYERVKILESDLKHQLSHPKRLKKPKKQKDDVKDYEYVDDDNPITPIMDFDERKKDEKFKLRPLRTTKAPTSPDLPDPVTDAHKPPIPKGGNPLRGGEYGVDRIFKRKKSKPYQPQPVDSFYRRMFEDMDSPVEWIHCQDLITPFFTGVKRDITVMKRVPNSDPTVRRFIQLIRLNTTAHTKEEMYSILYQISNLQLRLFQWDVTAISLLVAALTKDQPHSFQSINYGIKELLAGWHMDTGNTTNLLKQSRIFRPPCVRVSDYEGSTKSSQALAYTKVTTPRGKCSVLEDKNCIP